MGLLNEEKFGVPVTVGINEYYTDTKEEHQAIINFCENLGVVCKISSHQMLLHLILYL